MGVEPTTLKRTDLQSAAFADSLPTQIVAPILWRDRRHRRFFLFLKGALVYALIHQAVYALNGRPQYQGGPLWWNRWDLNPQPFPCKGIALPIAPRPHVRPPFYRVAGQIPLCVTHFQFTTGIGENTRQTLMCYPTPGGGLPYEANSHTFPTTHMAMFLPRKPRW